MVVHLIPLVARVLVLVPVLDSVVHAWNAVKANQAVYEVPIQGTQAAPLTHETL